VCVCVCVCVNNHTHTHTHTHTLTHTLTHTEIVLKSAERDSAMQVINKLEKIVSERDEEIEVLSQKKV
jgi:hypothetical protein